MTLTLMAFNFPGMPGLFHFEKNKELGKHPFLEIRRKFNLFNLENNPKSLINRVVIVGVGTDIVKIDIFYKATGCGDIMQAFQDIPANFIHNHKVNSCALRVTEAGIIPVLFKELCSSQRFTVNSKRHLLELMPRL